MKSALVALALCATALADWNMLNNTVMYRVQDLAVLSDTLAFAAGTSWAHRSVLYTSVDGGVVWMPANISVYPWQPLQVTATASSIVVSQSPSLWYSEDNGNTFSASAVKGNMNFTVADMGSSGDVVVLVGSGRDGGSTGAWSIDGGRSFSTLAMPPLQAAPQLVSVASPTTWYVVTTFIDPNCSCGTTEIVATTDAGQTWSTAMYKSWLLVQSFSCGSERNCCAAGYDVVQGAKGTAQFGGLAGAALCTSNGGSSWSNTYLSPGTLADVWDITHASPTEAWAVGTITTNDEYYGGIWHTTDAGTTWSTQQFSTIKPTVVSFASPSVGYAMGSVTDYSIGILGYSA